MLRVIAFLFFVLIGAAAGLAAAVLFRQHGLGEKASAIAGVLGAFAGLLGRDLLNVGGGSGAGIAAAAMGAMIVALLANLIHALAFRDRR